jgi:Mn2+/Fe2+ NRAMP family transporter
VILLTMTLTILQTYNVVERVSTGFLVLKVLLILAACVIVRPDWAAALVGFVVPRWPEFPGWLTTAYPEMQTRPPVLEVAVLLGTVGGGVQDYLGYVGCMREKPWGAVAVPEAAPGKLPLDPGQVRIGKAWLRAPALDVLFSFAAVLVMSVSFMLLGAAVLHPLHQVPTNADLYSKQAQFLGLIHPSLVNVYKAGVFFAMLGAVYGTFEVYARTIYEPVRALWPRRSWNYDRLRVANTLFCGLGGLLILWTGFQTVTLASIVSPFSGVMGCGLWCLAMIAVDQGQMPRAYRMPPVLRIATLLAGVGMAVVGGYVTYMSWRG